MNWRRLIPRNGWAVLAATCQLEQPTPWERMIALGANLRVTGTALAGKTLIVDDAALREIPRMRLEAEDAYEFGVRVPRDYRSYLDGRYLEVTVL